MSINQISNLPSSLVHHASPAQKQAASIENAVVVNSSANRSDQASLSAASTLLVQALRTPDVRTEKVATLQATIAAGTYNVSSADVAAKLVETLLR